MKTRFAPSPTGQMHLGNVRTALFSFLLAQHHQGVFLLRIEDTDAARSQAHFTDLLLTDLQWLNLHWQEGPVFQSQRQELYDRYYKQLAEQTYPCFCNDQQLALARKLQLAAGQPPRYSGTCRMLTAEQVTAKHAQGLLPALRFKVPTQQTIIFEDLIKGTQRFCSDEIGDFIIRRADGSPAFFFCNAIDDATLGVTHVLRGEDHLSNTPRQLLLLKTLQLPLPQYGHIPLIVGSDNSPLSKRNGSRSLQALQAQGYLPKAIYNYLARVGHYYANYQLLSLDQLTAEFAINHIGNTPAHFDEIQLLHWQKLAVAELTITEMQTWLNNTTIDKIPTDQLNDFLTLVKPNIVFPHQVDDWYEILWGKMTWQSAIKTLSPNTPAQFFNDACTAIAQNGHDYTAVTQSLSSHYRGKNLFQPLRVALTGQLQGPELAGIFALLTPTVTMQRLQQAQSAL